MWRRVINAPGDAHADLRHQLLGGLRAVRGQNLRNGVGEIVALAIGAISQRFDFVDARRALLQQFVFQRQ